MNLPYIKPWSFWTKSRITNVRIMMMIIGVYVIYKDNPYWMVIVPILIVFDFFFIPFPEELENKQENCTDCKKTT